MKHLFIPDTQIRVGVPTEHLEAAGNYMVDKRPDVVIVAGDWWDMPSLSSYDKPGSKKYEGRRYSDDVMAGIKGMELFLKPLREHNEKMRRQKLARYNPRLVFTMGNHEYRINRAIENDPVKLEGVISTEDFGLEDFGFEVQEFQEIIEIDGILYSHFFVNQDSLKKNILGGTITNRLYKIGHSFTMGHQQTKLTGQITTATGEVRRGLVAGAFYQHDEDYAGPQGNHYWRGIVMKHEVKDGNYDLMEVSIGFLMENYL